VSPAGLAPIAITLGGVVGWIVADAPVVATLCVVAADMIGVALMLPKTYRDPGSETLATLALTGAGGALGAAAVGSLDPALLVYAYHCLANSGIALLIVTRRRALPAVAVTH
jgi:hypothetical protein